MINKGFVVGLWVAFVVAVGGFGVLEIHQDRRIATLQAQVDSLEIEVNAAKWMTGGAATTPRIVSWRSHGWKEAR